MEVQLRVRERNRTPKGLIVAMKCKHCSHPTAKECTPWGYSNVKHHIDQGGQGRALWRKNHSWLSPKYMESMRKRKKD